MIGAQRNWREKDTTSPAKGTLLPGILSRIEKKRWSFLMKKVIFSNEKGDLFSSNWSPFITTQPHPFRRICHPPKMNVRIYYPQKFFILTVCCSMFIAVPTLYKISTILLFADGISAITDIGITYPDERDGTLFFVQRVKEGVTVFTVRICW